MSKCLKRMILETSGYALPSVLLITMLVVTSIMGLLTVIFFYDGISMRMIEKKKLDLAGYSALQMLLSDTTGISAGNRIYNIDSISVTTNTRLKGFYWEVTTIAKGKNDSSLVNYLLGSPREQSVLFTNAIVLSRPNLRATVAGNTKITGNILATTKRITKGNIFGLPPVKKNYLDGEIIVDTDIPVQLAQDSLFDKTYYDLANRNSSYIEFESFHLDENTIKTIDGSELIKLSADLQLSGKLNSAERNIPVDIFAVGKVIINKDTYSDVDLSIIAGSEVEIGKNVHLENVLIFSESAITISADSYFKNVQFFSRDKIIIRGSLFDYPSLICLNIDASDSSKLNNSLDISSSVINGAVLLMTSSSGLSSNKTKIKIDDKSKIQGVIYSENNLELLGEVQGSVYSYNFWFYKEPTEYTNWLVNIHVNRRDMSDWFLLPAALSESTKLEVLKKSCIY
ncbi:hypothetical protein ACFLSH_02885 [Bacteroidota bacterium]